MMGEGGRFRYSEDAFPEDAEDWGSEHYENHWGGPEEGDLEGFYAEQDEDLAELEGYLHDTEACKTDRPLARRVYRWRYDNTGYYAYVLLNGNEALRDEVIAGLKAAGISVEKANRAGRLADNRKRYEWYVRVSKGSGAGRRRHPERHVIARVLERIPGYEPDEPKEFLEYLRRTSELEGELAGLKADLGRKDVLLSRRLEKNRALNEALEKRRRGWAMLHDKYVRSQDEVAKLVRRARDLSAELEELRAKGSSRDKDVAQLSATLREARSDLDGWLAEHDRLLLRREEDERATEELLEDLQESKEELASAQEELDATRERLEAMERERQETEQKSRVRRVPRKRFMSRFGELLSSLLPNLRFHNGSIDVLCFEFRKPTKALEVLRILDSNPGSLKSERVEGRPKWKEERFGTGGDVPGRLYYRQVDGGLYEVRIGDKGSQKKDMAALE